MSHSFAIRAPDAFERDELLNALACPNVQFTSDSAASKAGEWPLGESHLYIDGISPRPLMITRDDEALTVRIMTGCCADTCMLARDIAAWVAEKFATRIQPEGELATDAPRFLRAHARPWAQALSEGAIRNALRMYETQRSRVRLTGTHRVLELGPRLYAQLTRDPERAVAAFFETFRKLNYLEREDVFIGHVTVMRDKQKSRELRMAVYGGVATLVPLDVDVVTLICGADEMLEITPEVLLDLTSNLGTWLSEDQWLLPGLAGYPHVNVFTRESTKPEPGSAYAQLLERARAHRLSDVFARGRAVERVEEGPAPSAAEWQCLVAAPVAVFAAVAAADGNVDESEAKTFQRLLLDLHRWKSPLMTRVIVECAPRLRELVQQVSEGEHGLTLAMVRVTRALAGTQTAETARAFASDLFELAQEVANAAGGRFGLDEVPPNTQHVLERLRVLLAAEPLRRQYDAEQWACLVRAPVAVFVLAVSSPEGFHPQAAPALQAFAQSMANRKLGSLFVSVLIEAYTELGTLTRAVVEHGAEATLERATAVLNAQQTPAARELVADLLELARALAENLGLLETPYWELRSLGIARLLPALVADEPSQESFERARRSALASLPISVLLLVGTYGTNDPRASTARGLQFIRRVAQDRGECARTMFGLSLSLIEGPGVLECFGGVEPDEAGLHQHLATGLDSLVTGVECGLFREAEAQEALDCLYELGAAALGDSAAPVGDLVLGALNAMREVLRSSQTESDV